MTINLIPALRQQKHDLRRMNGAAKTSRHIGEGVPVPRHVSADAG